jgi:hypothetical protein
MQVLKNVNDLSQTVDRRGGHRWSVQYDAKKEGVLTYVNQYRDQSDYSEKPKVYLPCTIKNLCDHYNSEVPDDQKVLYGYFRGLVAAHFEPVFTQDPSQTQPQSVVLGEGAYSGFDDGQYYHGYNGDEEQEQYEKQEEPVTYQDAGESILGD